MNQNEGLRAGGIPFKGSYLLDVFFRGVPTFRARGIENAIPDRIAEVATGTPNTYVDHGLKHQSISFLHRVQI